MKATGARAPQLPSARELSPPPDAAFMHDLPGAHFKAILADPPWHFRGYTDGFVSNRDPRRHYRVMDLPAIKSLPVRDYAATSGCHLFLWATGPCIPQALEVIEAWGFRYSGIAFVWVKLKRSHDARQLRFVSTAEGDLHVGLGFTTRKNAEFVLLARRGNARRIARDVREIVLSPVREHSRKPDDVHARIERYCNGPYLELFGRQERAGWTVRGDQLGQFV